MDNLYAEIPFSFYLHVRKETKSHTEVELYSHRQLFSICTQQIIQKWKYFIARAG